MSTILKLTDVCKVYGGGGTEVTALHPTTIEIKKSEFVGIVGPSGSGKSTLLSIAGALLSPSKGEVMLGNKNITNISDKEKTDIRLNQIGFIFQYANLVPYLNVKEQLIYIAKLKKENNEEAEERAEALLATFGLHHRQMHYSNQLSGGERQRVAIARAFMNNPQLILADEPTASLDSKKARDVVEKISEQVKKSNKAAIMITHDENMLNICDRVLILRDGKLQ
ncbi:ABC transporter ATP-binding protein [Bacillus bombysepticus]|uniref:ABC transporter ATP-binding protein n=1 Tax=Bacillus bombysepticus TaxID=658666 RepID=UPI0030165F59